MSGSALSLASQGTDAGIVLAPSTLSTGASDLASACLLVSDTRSSLIVPVAKPMGARCFLASARAAKPGMHWAALHL